jgi:hypothetical protein
MTTRFPRWKFGVLSVAAVLLVVGVMLQQSGLRFLPGNASLGPAKYAAILDSEANAPVSEVPELLKRVASLSTPNPHALRPSQVVVRSQRPALHWEPIVDADAYEIDIRSESAPVAKILLPGAEWTPEADLQRGNVYSWKVVPYKGGQPLQGVTGLTGFARFGVLPDRDEKMVKEVLAQFPDSHLLIAAIYLRAGLINEADEELDLALDPAKDSGDVAEKLRTRINAIREGIK